MFQRRFDERVKVAIEHLLRCRGFVVGAQILDAAVVEHVAADLVAPADVGLGVFELLLFGLALAHLMVVQAAAQALPCHIAVAVLAAPVLALHHDAGRHVGQAHGGVGFVDVLAAGATGAESVNANVRWVDIDLDRIIDFGVDKDRGERGVAPTRRVEWRFAHQAVHAGLGAQQAKSVFTLDLDGCALDASGVASGLVFDRDGEAFAFGVAQVLAQQHAGPVAGFGATGPGLDVDKGVQWIGRVVEHAAELEPLDDAGQSRCVGFDGLQAGLVVVVFAHVEQLAVVREFAGERVERDHNAVERFLFAAQFLGALGVVPDGRVFE